MSGRQNVDDIQLLIKAQAGEAEAFGKLYERYAQTVFRFLFAHLNDRMDAEDLTEEVFLRVWRGLPDYREKGVPFLAYLFRIARNALIDFYRRSGRSGQHLSLNAHSETQLGADPGESLLENLEFQEIRQTLAKLKDDYRTVLLLRFISELSPEETARAMGRTEGAVRILQHRALVALRGMLNKLN